MASYNYMYANQHNPQVFVRDRLYEDCAKLGWSITPTTQVVATPAGKRKIALAVCSTGYHFYVRNQDGTWSHKAGDRSTLNTSIVSRVPLTDYNIAQYGLETYDLAPMQFFFISKNAMVYNYAHEFGHDSNSRGTPIGW